MTKKDEIKAVKKLGNEIGYGHLMSLASAIWRHNLEEKYPGTGGGAFIPTIMNFIKDDAEMQDITISDTFTYDEYLDTYK